MKKGKRERERREGFDSFAASVWTHTRQKKQQTCRQTKKPRHAHTHSLTHKQTYTNTIRTRCSEGDKKRKKFFKFNICVRVL